MEARNQKTPNQGLCVAIHHDKNRNC
jgi:hypothetical protein